MCVFSSLLYWECDTHGEIWDMATHILASLCCVVCWTEVLRSWLKRSCWSMTAARTVSRYFVSFLLKTSQYPTALLHGIASPSHSSLTGEAWHTLIPWEPGNVTKVRGSWECDPAYYRLKCIMCSGWLYGIENLLTDCSHMYKCTATVCIWDHDVLSL